LYNIIVPKPFTFSYVTHDHVTCDCDMWWICDSTCNIILSPNYKFQNKKINGTENKNEKEKENK